MDATTSTRKAARDLRPGDHIEYADHQRHTVLIVHATKRNVMVCHEDPSVEAGRFLSADATVTIHPTSTEENP